MIRAVLLDIDNTLLDFDAYVHESMKKGFEKFGLGDCNEHTYSVFHTVNNGLWKEIEFGTLTFEELKKIRWNKVFEALGITFDGVFFETYFREYLNESAIHVKGAGELLEYLYGKGYILCAASNGPYEQQCNRLKIGGMSKYFSFFFISGKIGYSKPATEFFDVCFNEINKTQHITPVKKEEILMIGDSFSADIVGARNYGFKTCYFNMKGKEFDKALTDYAVCELEEIKRVL